MITHLSTLYLAATEHLAVENVDPVPPPGSGGLLQLVSYAKYLGYLGGLIGIIYGGGRFAWEKWNGGSVESPKIISACLVGGIVIAVSTPLLNAAISAAGR